MIGENKQIFIMDKFLNLAHLSHAKLVVPYDNGSLLFIFDDEDDKRELIWQPGHEKQQNATTELPGRFIYPRNPERLPKDDVSKISQVVKHGDFKFLAWQHNVDTKIELSKWFIKAHLMDFLHEKQSIWGKFVFNEVVEVKENVIRLDFSSQTAKVIFEVRVISDPEIKNKKDWKSFGAIAVCIVEDSRKKSDKTKFINKVESYLYYSFSRAFAKDQQVREKNHSNLNKENKREELRVKRDEGLGNYHHESDVGLFFLPVRDYTDYDAAGTIMEHDNGFAVVVFGSFACQKHARVSGLGLNSHRLNPIRVSKERPWVHYNNFSEMDLIFGSENGFFELIKNALDSGHINALVIYDLCVADLIGVDIEGIAREAIGDREIPILRTSCATPARMDIWAGLFNFREQGITPKAHSVNLMGFVPVISKQADFICDDLGKLGIEVNSMIGPSFTIKQMKRFNQASVTIINDDNLAGLEFAQSIKYHKLDVLACPPPFGIKATLEFYTKVAKACGVQLESEKLEALFLPFKVKLENLIKSAEKYEVAIVLDFETSDYITKPETMYGLDLVSLLSEFGFKIRFVCLSQFFVDDAEGLKEQLEQQLESRLPKGFTPSYTIIKDPEKLSKTLLNIPSRFIVTEYPNDQRVLNSGKLPIYLYDFEMGSVGALRSLERLMRRADSLCDLWLSNKTNEVL